MEIVRDSVFYSIPKSPKEGVRVKGKCVRASVVFWCGPLDGGGIAPV